MFDRDASGWVQKAAVSFEVATTNHSNRELDTYKLKYLEPSKQVYISSSSKVKLTVSKYVRKKKSKLSKKNAIAFKQKASRSLCYIALISPYFKQL